MSRSFTAPFGDQDITDDVIRPVYIVVIDLPHPTQVNTTVTHALWTEDFDINNASIDGTQYDLVGAGDLLSVSDLNETSDLTASGLSIRLVASTDFVTVLRDREYQGYPVKVYLGITEVYADGRMYTPKTSMIFDGFIDQMLFSITENAVVITLKAESKLIRLAKSSNRSYTQEDQIAEYPNDKGFEYMNNLQDREVLWGRK